MTQDQAITAPAASERKVLPRAAIVAMLSLLALSAFMYVSIMYKIIKFGP